MAASAECLRLYYGGNGGNHITKNEFLQALDARLDGLTDAERRGILDYYGEIN